MNLSAFNEAAAAAYAEIDSSIATLKIKPHDPMTVVQTPESRLTRAITIYRAVRPFFAAASVMPFVPAAWRAAVQLFVVALDGVAGDVASADFKAGKDL